MDLMEAIRARHSVRQYQKRPIEGEVLAALRAEIDRCNAESGLHIQLVTGEPKAFDCFLAHYGSFRGVENYLALVGTASEGLDEACGYYGERIVLRAQQLGLNTCWVKLTYKKVPGVIDVKPGEKLAVVIAIGYGENEGKQHRSKKAAAVSDLTEDSPDWFRRGVEAALLAPTAVNQQKFYLERRGDRVAAKAGFGNCTKMDLGIVKYHFEIGAGTEHFMWV